MKKKNIWRIFMKPDFVTFTGADDSTSYEDMLALSYDHPVEFAILFSKSREGAARYPTKSWIDGLAGMDLSLAAHICGEWAAQVVENGVSDVDDRLGLFDRIQVNTASAFDLDLICAWKERLHKMHGREFRIILQTRNTFPEDPRVEWLFDASGGRGIEPTSWPAPPENEDVRFGYAGGMGPDNVEDIITAINSDEPYWIDMETRIRNAEDLFDIDMCRKVCELACEED
jgi:hypothetical protein